MLDLRRTLGVHARGGGDPAYRVAADNSIWRTSLTPDGPGYGPGPLKTAR